MGQDFFDSRVVNRPRKTKRCSWCGEPCPAGEPRVAYACLFDGDFTSGALHAECLAAAERYDDPMREGWGHMDMRRGCAAHTSDDCECGRCDDYEAD